VLFLVCHHCNEHKQTGRQTKSFQRLSHSFQQHYIAYLTNFEPKIGLKFMKIQGCSPTLVQGLVQVRTSIALAEPWTELWVRFSRFRFELSSEPHSGITNCVVVPGRERKLAVEVEVVVALRWQGRSGGGRRGRTIVPMAQHGKPDLEVAWLHNGHPSRGVG